MNQKKIKDLTLLELVNKLEGDAKALAYEYGEVISSTYQEKINELKELVEFYENGGVEYD